MLLYFPNLHPELAPEAARAAFGPELRFLDPGLARPVADGPQHRPQTLPFDQRTARALLADTLRFGETMASPRDILAQGLVEKAGSLSPESSRAVLSEVERSMTGAAADRTAPKPPQDAARERAQMLLLLAWSLEEKLMELRAAEDRIGAAWARLDNSVAPGDGEAEDDADHDALLLGRELSGLTLPVDTACALPWRRLAECFAVLAPGTALATADARIAGELAEQGVPARDGEFTAPGWRFCGLDRPDPARPWLDADLILRVVEG
jgi:hypothetical protein